LLVPQGGGGHLNVPNIAIDSAVDIYVYTAYQRSGDRQPRHRLHFLSIDDNDKNRIHNNSNSKDDDNDDDK